MTDDAIFIGTDATKTGIKRNLKLFKTFLIKEKHGILPLWNVIFMLINPAKPLGLMSC
jgi:hypothetical protein